MKFLLTVLVLFSMIFYSNKSYSQNNDTLQNYPGTVIIKETNTVSNFHSPKKAAIMSAALPGLGQIYNKSYWKLPIVYGGISAGVYMIIDNNNMYQKYREAYILRKEGSPDMDDSFSNYSTENLRILKNYYWDQRDLFIIVTALFYTINILDAIVDAHFYNFDISEDLSLKIQPIICPTHINNSAKTYTAINFSLSF